MTITDNSFFRRAASWRSESSGKWRGFELRFGTSAGPFYFPAALEPAAADRQTVSLIKTAHNRNRQ
jgi:hypothetical protein